MSDERAALHGLLDVHVARDPDAVRLRATVDTGHPILEDHFPGQPTVPGFLQLDWILQCLRLGGELLEHAHRGFEVEQMKFLRRLQGGETIDIRIERLHGKKERTDFSITLDGVLVTSGRLVIGPG